jgi:hypothetical protein
MPHRAINGTKAGDLLLPPTPPPHRGSLRSRLRRDFDVFDILWCIVLVGMNCEMTKEVWLFAASASPPSRPNDHIALGWMLMCTPRFLVQTAADYLTYMLDLSPPLNKSTLEEWCK